jgi:hypothetical protein
MGSSVTDETAVSFREPAVEERAGGGNRERARSSIVSLASAVLGNGAAVGVEDGGDHALLEPVRVGY